MYKRGNMDELDKLIEVKLQEVFSTFRSAKDLPKSLLKFLANPKIQAWGMYGNPGNEKLLAPVTARRIDMLYRETIQFLKSMEKEYEFVNRNFQHIASLQLYTIFVYRNGDTAWYSFSNKNVHDFNHDLVLFNSLSNKAGLTKVVGYKQWMSEIISGKRIDAWER
jgi:hypothetical protein